MEEAVARPEQDHEGERYLQMLDLGHLAGKQIPVSGGGTIEARNFLEVCGEHARPALVGFGELSEEDPRYPIMKSALRGMIARYIGEESPSQ